MRPLLRWISLASVLVVLAVLGVARLHLHNFVLFLAIVLGLAVAIAAVFVATASGDDA
jgi:hypothetical protein